MQIAAEDAELMVRESMDERQKYAAKLTQVFHAADTSGDGRLSFEELQEILKHKKILAYLSLMDLQVPDALEVFNVLDNGDGHISFDEFMMGLSRLKGQARSLDVIFMMRDARVIMRKVDELERRLEQGLPAVASSCYEGKYVL